MTLTFFGFFKKVKIMALTFLKKVWGRGRIAPKVIFLGSQVMILTFLGFTKKSKS
jgi:hypothetical protein